MINIKPIALNKDTKYALQTPMPAYIHKTKGSGRNAATYVSGQSVIDKLNATFGHAGWSWDIIERWVEQSENKIIKTKYENGQSIKLPEDQWIIEKQLPVAHIIGKLTVFFERPDGTLHTVSKMAPGAQPLVGGQSEQENMFKGAHTDALKKAATMFGIGLELYRDSNEQAFFNELCYENPWTEEVMTENKENFEYINWFKSSYNLQDSDLDSYMYAYSHGQLPTYAYLLPENISGFVEYLKEVVAKAQAAQQNQAQGA